MKKFALLTAHLVFINFNLLTAVYCLLAYLPFTYHQVHAGHLIPWLDKFVELHPLANLVVLPLAILLMVDPWRAGGAARWLAAGFGALEIIYAGVLAMHPVLSGLENNSTSLLYSMAALAAVTGVAAVDIACYRGHVRWLERPPGYGAAHFAASWGAVFVSAVYTVVFFLLRPEGLSPREQATTLGWSLLAHLVFFLGLFLLLEVLTALASTFGKPAMMEFWLGHFLLATAIAALLRVVIWPSIGFAGWRADLFSGALGVTLASVNAGMALWLLAGQSMSDGIAAAVAPATLGLTHSWRAAATAVVVAGFFGVWVAVSSAALDWNYLLQKLTAAAIWMGAFAAFYTIGARRKQIQSTAWLAVPLLLLGAYKGLEAAAPGTEALLERGGGYDASFLLVRQFLAPPKRDSGSFYQFLNKNTNIAASVHVEPAPVVLAPDLAPSEDPPNIFLFTIDSLRRDYISPYNSNVSFTPSIDSFARESTVFESAFTRYGGTGLSEPAIWAGALLLHKQYVTPFAPMNALEKLIRAEHYQVFLSRDSILQTILTPSTETVELDPPEATMSLDFGRTLEKLAEQIDRRSGTRQPIFAYTQPQNLHISVIQREGASVPAGESYPGFYAPYASRVRRVDQALGKFVDFLKSRGLYERSIIVLTADHGDSLGEGGRWGHAYTLFPEIVRIPMIVHLPGSLRGKVGSDPGGLAFSTDVTPSLYYLLGHRPVQRNELFGSPLFTESPAERQRDPRAEYLMVSSYAAVYGVLSNGGRRLYVADGVNYRNYLFDLSPKGARPLPVSRPVEQEQDELIRRQILGINRFYGFGDPKGGVS